ncbi:MAG: hypothetical protein MZW92_53150 [Comamonadaceae bacterium]|nr:hypothetical protein [Comamonadaceae bacterium]
MASNGGPPAANWHDAGVADEFDAPPAGERGSPGRGRRGVSGVRSLTSSSRRSARGVDLEEGEADVGGERVDVGRPGHAARRRPRCARRG